MNSGLYAFAGASATATAAACAKRLLEPMTKVSNRYLGLRRAASLSLTPACRPLGAFSGRIGPPLPSPLSEDRPPSMNSGLRVGLGIADWSGGPTEPSGSAGRRSPADG